jgi:hypothetical protein
MEWFVEVFGSISEAIGLPARDGYRVIDNVRTKKPEIAEQGFRRTLYVVTKDGRKWTVHHDRTHGRYAGRHWSTE